MANIKDKFFRDLGIDYFKSKLPDNVSDVNLDNFILEDFKKSGVKDDEKILEDYSGNISIKIQKENTSFDFANKFREYLQNSIWKKKDQTILFLKNSSNEIGKVIYERVQNFLNNYINVDSCHYKALISQYAQNNIDINEFFTKNLPDKLDYLINIFSVSKLYLKNNFYNLSIQDSTISDYISQIENTNDLTIAERYLKTKYFGNFYQSVVYPIIKNELYNNYKDEEIKKYIEDSTASVYDNCLYGKESKYIFLLTLKSVLSPEIIEKLSEYGIKKLLEKYPVLLNDSENIPTVDFTDNTEIDSDASSVIEEIFNSIVPPTGDEESETISVPDNIIDQLNGEEIQAATETVSESDFIGSVSKKYFSTIINNIPSCIPNKDGTYPTIDLTASGLNVISISTSATESIDENLVNLNYNEASDLIEEYIISRQEFIKLLRIKLCAQKLANICNAICKLREEIKQIRIKDSKIGTAALIEELICEYVYKAFTKKIGIEHQGKVPNNLKEFEETIANIDNLELRKKLEDLYNSEQKAIGVKFESHFNELKQLVQVLDCDIVEYIDTTTSYLNINPENDIITVKQKYNVERVQYPPYLNINGLAVYANWDDKTDLNESDYSKDYPETENLYQWSEPIDGNSNNRRYYIDKKEFKLNELNQFQQYNGELEVLDNIIYYCPENSNKFIKAENMSSAKYNDTKKLYFKKYPMENGVGTPGIIVDLYDRNIEYNIVEDLIDANDSVVMSWKNGKLELPKSGIIHLVQEVPGGFRDKTTGLDLAYVDKSAEGETIYDCGLYSRLYSGEYEYYHENVPGTIFKQFIQIKVVDGTSTINYIYSGKPGNNGEYSGETTYLQYMTGKIYDTEVNAYQIRTSEEYFVEYTGEELGFTDAKQLYNADGYILNNYQSDTERLYAIENRKNIVVEKIEESIKDVNGNSRFWDDLDPKILYEDKTPEEERDIIKFYKKLGLINDDLDSRNFKTVSADGNEETLTVPWMLAREKIIDQLKLIWKTNAQHTWYDPVNDDNRLNDGIISKQTLDDLKEMDKVYHSNIGISMKRLDNRQVLNSLVNLENWENNTVAVHPFIWNLVEKVYNSYITLLTISLYGTTIIDKIFAQPRTWQDVQDENYDNDGLFSFTSDGSFAHIVDYWKNYGKSFFAYSTEYETENNEIKETTISDNNSLSRYVGFDGPFNYEALLAIIDKYWTPRETLDKNSIRLVNLSKYYIDINE